MNKYLTLSFLLLIGCQSDIMVSTETDLDISICGNEIIEEKEECDEISESCENCIIIDRKIFVSDYESDGGLITFKCQLDAEYNGLYRGLLWYPWISTSEENIIDVLNSKYPYKLIDGTLIANNLDDLIDGKIENPINLDQYGTLISNANVWTGTNEFGKHSGDSCLNWAFNNESTFGTYGNTSLIGKQWTNYQKTNCNKELRVYCIEN